MKAGINGELRKATAVGRRQIINWVVEGLTRKEIAGRLNVSVAELRKHYGPELAGSKSGKVDPKAAAQDAPRAMVRGKFTAYTFGDEFPANSPFSFQDLSRVALQISWFDTAGVPHDARYRPIFGKRESEIAMGRKGFIGTEWEVRTTVSGVLRSTRPEDWDCSLPDWEKHFMAGGSLIPKRIKNALNKELALKAVEAFNKLRLSDVPGQPTMAEAGGDWFREIVEVVIGSYDPVTKSRKIKELFLLIPKKNMKTTGGALIMLLLLIYNERPNGLGVMCAPVHEVAEVAFKAIAGAIELDPVLSRVFDVREHWKLVIDRRNDAELKVMTFDPATLTGQKITFAALVDEVHVIAKNPKAASALRQIRGNMFPFPEAILIFITTQSEESPQGVFETELTAARNIRDGKRKDAKLLPILYEFPESIQKSPDQKWRDPKLWSLVTPNMNRSIALDVLVSAHADAESKGEAELRAWASQHLNIQIGLALRSNAWVGADAWTKGDIDSSICLETILERCEVIEIGIDGGGLNDLLAINVSGRLKEDVRWVTWGKAWAHPVVLERNSASRVQLEDLIKAGDLELVETPGLDMDRLIAIVEACHKSGLMDKVGLDPYGVSDIVDQILGIEGFKKEDIVGISQGWRLSGVIATVERAIASRKLIHGNQKLLNWCVSNAQVEARGNAQLITKAASGSAKIDALMAMLDAISLLAANPPAKTKRFQMFVLGGRPKVQSPQRSAA
jgi:phage terminase large subunit-like protein